jgi:hypothetical protein
MGFPSVWESKQRADRRAIPDEIDLLKAITEILNGLSDTKWQDVFRSWIERVEMVIDAGRGSCFFQNDLLDRSARAIDSVPITNECSWIFEMSCQ